MPRTKCKICVLKSVRYNWFYTPEGEQYREYNLGSDGVVYMSIEDNPYCVVVYFENGHREMLFNINLIVYS